MSRTFTTSRGVTLECLPIPALLEKLQAQHRMPEPPVYEIKTVTGAVEKHTHDETTLETDEDKAAWASYQKCLQKATEEFNQALLRLIMLRGLRVDLPADEEWIAEQKFIGITVPTDPLLRRMHWLETEALGTPQDYTRLVAGVMEASGVPQEVLEQAEATFRRDLGGNGSGEAAAAPGREGLADQSAVRANARGGKKRHA